MPSLLEGAGPVSDGDDGAVDVDDGSAGVNDGAEGQSQDHLLRLKYVWPRRDDFHHPHLYVAVSAEPYAATGSRPNRQVDQYSAVDSVTDVQG